MPALAGFMERGIVNGTSDDERMVVMNSILRLARLNRYGSEGRPSRTDRIEIVPIPKKKLELFVVHISS